LPTQDFRGDPKDQNRGFFLIKKPICAAVVYSTYLLIK